MRQGTVVQNGTPANQPWFCATAYNWFSIGLDWSDYAHRNVYASRDTVAPTLSHISVAGTSVVLTFSEALGAVSGLANSAFTVMKTAESVEETLTLSAAPVISGAAVTLTLMRGAVESIDTVTVRYDKPDSGSNNKLADRTDNEVEDFTTEADAAPHVVSIARQNPSASPTNANSLTWRVTFSKDVSNVDTTDFQVSGTTATPTDVSEVTASTVYDVTASGGNLAGLDATVTLMFATGQNIADTDGTALAGTAPTGTNESTWVVDNTAPRVTSIERQDAHGIADQRQQPDLEGDVRRGHGERGCDGFRGERHDGDADGGQRGNGLDGLRRDGQRGATWRPLTPR